MTERVKQSGLHYEISEKWRGHYEIGISNSGKVKDHFNLNKLISSYRLFSDRLGYDLLSSEDEENLLKTNEFELAFFIKGFDYGRFKK